MRFEITVIGVGIDAQDKFIGVALRVELGGVHIIESDTHYESALKSQNTVLEKNAHSGVTTSRT